MIHSEKLKQWYFNQPDKKRNTLVRILGVEYAHLRLPDASDLYVTALGLPFIAQLMPENFYTDKEWFAKNATRLSGTSCVYRVHSKESKGKTKELVIKWNRMGQDIPGGDDQEYLMNARFNSPFEEFCLIMELRREMYNLPRIPHVIHKPLAIYVPAEKNDVERMGRRKPEMEKIIAEHAEIDIDMQRSYAMIFEWVKGIDAVEAQSRGMIDEALMRRVTEAANEQMRQNGYFVRDSKPHHIILRFSKKKQDLLARAGRQPLTAIVDFELLARTPERDAAIKKAKRLEYHKRQAERFIHQWGQAFHPHLQQVNHLGIDYIYGTVETTQGRLWVVGADPYLFDYFLPERWERTKRTRLSMFSESYYTVTKDNLNLIWEVSKVGLRPDFDPFKPDEVRILEYGYNSPFEEVALAIELERQNIPTIYPRAIYMTGFKTEISELIYDPSRYMLHQCAQTPDELPILCKDHEYIIIWGYWNGADALLAENDMFYCTGINALRAYRNGYITEAVYLRIIGMMKERLRAVGVEDLNLRGTHLLLSLDKDNKLIMGEAGLPEVRICNFEFLRKIEMGQG
ncbi:MAG: hypothetical protein NC924_05100 [Candidatus Omnitrophica bacterium]|nr:hypothetical protein [Candidatus Omnitrophota bacterium]